jgi:hypothetical protein
MKKFDKAVEEKLASMSYKNSIINEYNNTIRYLWKTEFKNAIKASNKSKVIFSQPCFHVTQDESPVWFFGMNPSLPESPKEIISQNSNLTKNLIVKLKDEQKSMHDNNHPYFKAAKNFFKKDVRIGELTNPIFHDLYPVMHTKQKEFVQFLEHKENNDFCERLNKATKELVDGIMPDIIVIANAKASKFMQKIFFGRTKENEHEFEGITKLTYELHGKKTDMIFSSMLSGQRALDTYSRSRLAREIRETWNSRNNK